VHIFDNLLLKIGQACNGNIIRVIGLMDIVRALLLSVGAQIVCSLKIGCGASRSQIMKIKRKIVLK
jgi:hypothetical protein